MKEWGIRIAVGLAAAVLVVIAITWIASGELPDPARRNVGLSPADLHASNVTFASGSGVLIQGWLAPGNPGQGVIVLLHELRGDRRDMVSRAVFLRKLGYSVLLFDFQAHGETRGQRITFGDLESRDVTAAIQYLHFRMPNEKVGVLGVSLGAAAFVLAQGRPPVAAVVLEQMYSTIEQAVEIRARLHLGPFAIPFAPLLMEELQYRLGIPANHLRPIEWVPKIGAPVLIVDGSEDNYTPIGDARAAFAAASEPKELWAVEGAGHVNLHKFAKAEYERRVGDFFGRYLAAH
jgi:fermentation-respiration switch protein FrsA (DUF1100 family)